MNIIMTNFSEITSPGGVHKTIREIARHISKKGNKVTILQSNELGLPREDSYEGFNIIRINTKFGNSLYGLHPELYFFFKNNLKNLKPDVIHIHGYHTLFSPEIVFLSIIFHPNVPLVFSPHFGILSHNTFAGKHLWTPYNKFCGQKIFKFCRKTIAASKFEANNLHSILAIPRTDIAIIPHGVDTIDLSDVKINDGIIRLLYVGYLLELKGVHHIIRALHELIRLNGNNFELTIVGNGPYESNLKKLAEDLNIADYINWVGFQPSCNLFKYYKEADLLLFTSESENYGIVAGESLALGTPVIVSKIPALTEFLDEPGCFAIDLPINSSELSTLILKIVTTHFRVGPFSERIRTWDIVAKDYENLYKTYISK